MPWTTANPEGGLTHCVDKALAFVGRVLTGRWRSRELPVTGGRTLEQLTHVEREVCGKLIGAYQCRDLLPEMRDRIFPLICGPSGAGKTTAVRAAANEISRLHYRAHPRGKVAYMELHATSWIPAGAAQPTTLRVISDAINLLTRNRHGLLIIFFDELDKLRNTTRGNGNSAWHIGNMQEIQALLGRSAGILPKRFAYALSCFFRRVKPAAVLRNAYLIGAGAFQDAYQTSSGAFRPDALNHNTREDALLFETHSARETFNGDDFQLFTRAQWIMLPPPSPEDLRRAARIMIEGPMRRRLEEHLDLFVERASSTQSPFRTLEALIMTKCLELQGKNSGLTDRLVLEQGTTHLKYLFQFAK
ncbi:MAG: ATP-binding protein [bacterium]